MFRYADPSVNRLSMEASIHGFGSEVYSKDQLNVVRKYLAYCKKRKEKAELLCPACMKIVLEEINMLKWSDECFKDYVSRMFSGADISQLESFYSRYSRTKKKTIFFLNFVRNEL